MRTRTIVVALLLAVGATVGVTSTAQAATCSGSSCNGVNPHDAGCDLDNYTFTVATASSTYGTAQLRDSLICDAVWGRFIPDNGSFCPIETVIQVQIGVRRADGTIDVVNSVTKEAGPYCQYYTTMLNGSNRLTRVRGGYVEAWPGGSTRHWQAWSGWATA
jgi:hypothetical protein